MSSSSPQICARFKAAVTAAMRSLVPAGDLPLPGGANARPGGVGARGQRGSPSEPPPGSASLPEPGRAPGPHTFAGQKESKKEPGTPGQGGSAPGAVPTALLRADPRGPQAKPGARVPRPGRARLPRGAPGKCDQGWAKGRGWGGPPSLPPSAHTGNRARPAAPRRDTPKMRPRVGARYGFGFA